VSISPREVALVPVLGLPGAGKTTLAARLVEAAIAGGARLAGLPDVARELSLRGLRREEEAPRHGARTTRQILDATLRDGKLHEGAPEDEALYVEPVGAAGRTLALVDTPGRRTENDALAEDPVHAQGALGREAAAVILVLDAAAWAAPAGPREAERDRAEALLRRLAKARAERGPGRLPVVIAAARADLAPGLPPGHGTPETQARGASPAQPAPLALVVPPSIERLVEAFAPLRSLEVAAIAVARDPSREHALRALLLWLLPRAVPPIEAPMKRRVSRALQVALALMLLVYATGFLSLRSLGRAPRREAMGEESAAARERVFLEEAEARIALWSALPLPSGGAEEALRTHAGFLEEDLLREHPALLEPGPAVELTPAQYRGAAQGLALAARHLGASDERRAREERLRAKARTAEMPAASRATLPAWEELWRTTSDPVVRDGVIAPRLRPLYAAIVAEASREAESVTRYPEILLPLVERAAALAPPAQELFRPALERAWERALTALYARWKEPGQDDPETLLRALETAPAPPPDAARERIGRWLAEAVVARPPSATAIGAPASGAAASPEASARVARLLGDAGARGLHAAIPALYAEMAASSAEAGPARLQGMIALCALAPRAPLGPARTARLDALALHLESLTKDGAYSLHVTHALMSVDFGSFLNPFDMTIGVQAQRAKERSIGPIARCRELRPKEPLFGPGELPWRAWDRIEVRVTDSEAPLGIFRRGPGTCFGLHEISGEWIDPASRGRMTIAVSPEPPRPFAFEGW